MLRRARRPRQIKGVAKRDAVQNPKMGMCRLNNKTLLSNSVVDHDGKGVSVSEIPEERKTAEMTVLRATTPPFQGTGFDLSRRIADSAYHRCVRISDEGRRSRPLHGERIVQGIRRSPKTGRHAKIRAPRFRAPLAARKME